MSAFQAVHSFLADCREISSPSRLGAYLQGRYKALFDKEPPNATLSLIKVKIAHRLQYVGMKSAGMKMSADFLKAYEASQRMDLDGLGDDLKFLVGLGMKKEQKGEVTMAKVKKAAKAEPAAKAAKKDTAPKPKRSALLAAAAKMGLKNRRAMNIPELVEVTKAGTSKARIDEILKKAVARWRSGLSK